MNDQDKELDAILDKLIRKLILKKISLQIAFIDNYNTTEYPRLNPTVFNYPDEELSNLAMEYDKAKFNHDFRTNGGKKRTRRGKSRSRKSRKKKRTKKRRT